MTTGQGQFGKVIKATLMGYDMEGSETVVAVKTLTVRILSVDLADIMNSLSSVILLPRRVVPTLTNNYPTCQIPSPQQSSVSSQADFLKEVTSMYLFDHVNVLKLLGVCTDNTPCLIVTGTHTNSDTFSPQLCLIFSHYLLTYLLLYFSVKKFKLF